VSLAVYDAKAVEMLLDYPGCIAAMRAAMGALSRGGPQPLRQIYELGPNQLYGTMPGSLREAGIFGAKLISVFHRQGQVGRAQHQGVVVAFDAGTGAVTCIADAEVITEVRTACASAAATDALARPEAQVLAVFGLGRQAASHIQALTTVRKFDKILLWGRSFEKTQARAAQLAGLVSVPIVPMASAQAAAEAADVICTVTNAAEPILLGAWVRGGSHVNLVGSSLLGPVEADNALVARARFIADYRPGVLAQGSELALARAAGLVDDDHVVGEIGDVFNGDLVGRQTPDQVTIYKSLGHVVQDLAAAAYVHARAQHIKAHYES
jgi:ornithine cyclodeaminase